MAREALDRGATIINDVSGLQYDPELGAVAAERGAAARLSDVAEVQDSVQDVRNLGMYNGEPSVLVILFRQPNANIIDAITEVAGRRA